MNDLVRPSTLFRSGVAAPAPAGVPASIPNPPPEAAGLSAGSVLRGVVAGDDGKGHVLVRTEIGILAVATKAHLAPNSEVVLQVRSSGTQLHVLIMQVRAQAPGTPGAPTLAAALAATGGGQTSVTPDHAPVPTAPDRLTFGQSIKAIIQAPPPDTAGGGPAQGAAAQPPLAPGSELLVRVLAVGGPTPTTGPTPPAGSPPVAPQAAPTPGSLPTPSTAIPGQGQPTAGAAVPPSVPPGGGPAPSPPAPGGAVPTGPSISAAIPAASPAANPAGNAAPAGTATAPGANLSPAPGANLSPAPGANLSPAPGASLAPVSGAAPSGPGASAGVGEAPAAISAAAPTIAGAYMARPTAAHPAPGAVGQPPGNPPGAPPGAPPVTPTTVATPPAVATLAPDAGAGLVRFTGAVTAATLAGHPVLATPLGTMTLEVRAALPPGVALSLETVLEPSVGAGAGGAPSPLDRPESLGRAWPALQDALQALREAGGGGGLAAAAQVPDTVPQTGPRLASGMLFFLAALVGGRSLSEWLGGPALATLKASGRSALIGRLSRDLGQMSRMADSASGDWRLLAIPIWGGGEVRQARLFLRQRQAREDAADDDAKATRFVLEVDMSRLGEMQLDGLVRKQRFDLILRTRAPLPPHMREHIRQIFTDANEAAGTVGGVTYQASATWRPLPVEGTAAPVVV